MARAISAASVLWFFLYEISLFENLIASSCAMKFSTTYPLYAPLSPLRGEVELPIVAFKSPISK